MLPPPGAPPVEWRELRDLMPYEAAVAAMEARAEAIAAGEAAEAVFLVEHPPLYTAGTSAGHTDPAGLRFPLYRTGRGGQLTYHGPGQRICYVMLDLSRRAPDLRGFVAALEAWIVATLADFDVHGERREERVGIWVARPDKPRGQAGEPAEDKIAAIGIRVRRWVSFHGLALNVAPDLSHFADIAPCGVTATHFGVTSLHDLGRSVTMGEVDLVLRGEFEAIFGATD
ncbi:MAG TPA: lipoyl(octanoyl) transferase LipB [Methylovirgula sp.]|nr:lipoyl(octanoyl) transferase LipB [Methylovirgula sp.]